MVVGWGSLPPILVVLPYKEYIRYEITFYYVTAAKHGAKTHLVQNNARGTASIHSYLIGGTADSIRPPKDRKSSSQLQVTYGRCSVVSFLILKQINFAIRTVAMKMNFKE